MGRSYFTSTQRVIQTFHRNYEELPGVTRNSYASIGITRILRCFEEESAALGGSKGLLGTPGILVNS